MVKTHTMTSEEKKIKIKTPLTKHYTENTENKQHELKQ